MRWNLQTKTLLLRTTGIIALVVVGVGLSYAARLIAVGTAYAAKMLCSEVFVAGRDLNAVQADLIIDDLSALQFFDASVDTTSKTAIASLYGFAKTRVRYRDDFGCALAADTTVATSSGISVQPIQPGRFNPNITQPVKLLTTHNLDNPQLAQVLDTAFSEPDPVHLRRTRAVVILHKNRIVAERYADNFSEDTPLPGWSMTKSVMNALTGILVNDNRFMTNTPVVAAAWHKPDDPRREITVEHLLHMTSGLEFNEDMTNPLADVSRMILWEHDMAKFATNKLLQENPGTRWQYSSGNTNVLAEFLRRTLGEAAYYQFPQQALFARIGMTKAVLEADASGTFVGSSFMYATAREWARFGQLYLQDGVWGNQRILPEGWVEYTQTPAPSDPAAAYGAHFWLHVPEEYRGSNITLPEDAFHAVGHEGQFITIIPSRDMVAVRLGKTRYSQAWKHDVFITNVLSALRE